MASHSTEHILIVEDDPIIAEMLRATLDYSGYRCEVAATGAAAVERFRSERPDAVVTDLGLPDTDGLELISVLRSLSQIPVIVVSGRSAEADKIAALDNGADDYIQKPFLPGELIARLRAKLRLYRHDQPVEPDSLYQLEHDVSLSRMERALLALLVQRQGATVPEEEIIATLWGPECRGTSGDLRSLVLKLRQKLQMERQPLFILNERGVGYYVSAFGRFPQRAKDVRHAAPKVVRPGRQNAKLFAWNAPAQSPATESDHAGAKASNGG